MSSPGPRFCVALNDGSLKDPKRLCNMFLKELPAALSFAFEKPRNVYKGLKRQLLSTKGNMAVRILLLHWRRDGQNTYSVQTAHLSPEKSATSGFT